MPPPISPGHLVPFPLRAAIDIGTGGAVWAVVAQVDVHHNAIRDIQHVTSVPLPAMSTSPVTGFLDVASEQALQSTMEMVMANVARTRPLEAAGILSGALADVANAGGVFERLCQRFRLRGTVLGGARHAGQPPRDEEIARRRLLERAAAFRSLCAAGQQRNPLRVVSFAEVSGGRLAVTAETGGNSINRDTSLYRIDLGDGIDSASSRPASRKTDALSMRKQSAQARVAAARRRLGSKAHDQSGSRDEALRCSGRIPVLNTWTSPLAVEDVHRWYFCQAQRRPSHLWKGEASSLNPSTAREFSAVTSFVAATIASATPEWLRDRVGLSVMPPVGEVVDDATRARLDARLPSFVCTATNGGPFNVAARATKSAFLSVDAIESAAYFQLAPLTDVLLAEGFPQPTAVLPSLALVCGTMKALGTRRARYLPDVSLGHGLLVDPTFWSSQKDVDAHLKEPENQSQRYFVKPHQATFQMDPNRPAEYTQVPHFRMPSDAASSAVHSTRGRTLL